jgi:NTE family protein
LLKNDFLSADFIIGDNIRYNIDYFIENGFNWSVGINTRFNKFKQDLVLSSLPQRSVEDLTLKVPIEYNDFTTRLYVQTTLTNKLALRIGIEHKYLNIFTEEIIDDKLEKLHFDKSNYYNLFGKLTIDSYDTNYFPKKGFYFNTDYIVYLLSSNFNGDFNSFSQLYGKIGFAQSFYSKLTLHLISEAGITIENNGNEVLDYHLGGNNENFINTFVPFYGYDVADLNETAFIRTELTVRYELFKNNFVSFTGNFGRLNEDLWNNGDIFEDTISGYAIGYGLKSFIGPLEIKYSWTPDNSSDYWYFNIGFWF